MLIRLSAAQAPLMDGAMRRVATAGGAQPLTDADRRALQAFDRFALRRNGVLAVDALPTPSAAEVAAAVPAPGDRDHVVQFLIVMALVDGTVDAKIKEVDAFAQALSVREDAVRQLAEVGRGHFARVRADVARRNLLSITGHDVGETIDEWILPYRERGDPALAARYRALGNLPEGTLGRTFCEFYRANGFALRGSQVAVDVFADDWSFWRAAREPLSRRAAVVPARRLSSTATRVRRAARPH